MKIKTYTFIVLFLISNSVFAELYGEMRNKFFAVYPPSCYKLQRENPINKEFSNDDLSRYCMCLTQRAANLPDFTNDLARKIDNLEVPFPATLIPQVTPICQKTFAEYPSLASSDVEMSLDGNELFGDKTQRYTASSRSVFSTDGKRLEFKSYSIGQHSIDINISLNRNENIGIDLETGQIYRLTRIERIPAIGRNMGIDYMFSFSELKEGYVSVLSTAKKILVRYTDPDNGTFIQTEYINSLALACKTLSIAKNNSQKSMAASIIKEALLVAIRSYAGASYSGGTFTGNTASGQAVSGTYMQYNNSWLGAHYSNGMNAIFNGTASYSQISEEMTRLQCKE